MKMHGWQALEALGTAVYWGWIEDRIGLGRGDNDKGFIQFDDRTTFFGTWDGKRGTDGALLTLENGDVYNECGGLVSCGPGRILLVQPEMMGTQIFHDNTCPVCDKHGCHDVAHKGSV